MQLKCHPWHWTLLEELRLKMERVVFRIYFIKVILESPMDIANICADLAGYLNEVKFHQIQKVLMQYENMNSRIQFWHLLHFHPRNRTHGCIFDISMGTKVGVSENSCFPIKAYCCRLCLYPRCWSFEPICNLSLRLSPWCWNIQMPSSEISPSFTHSPGYSVVSSASS